MPSKTPQTPYTQEGYDFMAAAFAVYNEVGHGMAEEIYQECLEIEMELRKIPFSSKQELTCHCKGRELKKKYVPDLFVFEGLIVELKSVTLLQPEHVAQLFNYLRISKQPVGYLVNFGHKGTLEWKRYTLADREEFVKSHPQLDHFD